MGLPIELRLMVYHEVLEENLQKCWHTHGSIGENAAVPDQRVNFTCLHCRRIHVNWKRSGKTETLRSNTALSLWRVSKQIRSEMPALEHLIVQDIRIPKADPISNPISDPYLRNRTIPFGNVHAIRLIPVNRLGQESNEFGLAALVKEIQNHVKAGDLPNLRLIEISNEGLSNGSYSLVAQIRTSFQPYTEYAWLHRLIRLLWNLHPQSQVKVDSIGTVSERRLEKALNDCIRRG
jgi:hypothetical protein